MFPEPQPDCSVCKKGGVREKKKYILVNQFTKGRGFSNILTSPVEVSACSGSCATPCPNHRPVFHHLLSSSLLGLCSFRQFIFPLFLMVSLTQGFLTRQIEGLGQSSRVLVGKVRSEEQKEVQRRDQHRPGGLDQELYVLSGTLPILVPKV